ncbi:MAG: response regulator transcription factor [Clostridia bacterium]|nr:response regulator transcription factor [Clostridia bacterium]
MMKDGKKCILVADDEREIRNVLYLLLSGEGYHVLCAEDGEEAVKMANADIDLYILDVNMPRLSGFMAGAEIRRQAQTPIIFLTAYSGESDKVMGFSVGADDYIVKPFSNAELLMRIKAVLRRSGGFSAAEMTSTSQNRLALGDLYLDTDQQAVIKDGIVISLTYTEYKILELLITDRKKIFSLDQIYAAVWDDNAVGDSAIMVHIKNIRKKLGDDSRNPKYIKTAWGRGYYVE